MCFCRPSALAGPQNASPLVETRSCCFFADCPQKTASGKVFLRFQMRVRISFARESQNCRGQTASAGGMSAVIRRMSAPLLRDECDDPPDECITPTG